MTRYVELEVKPFPQLVRVLQIDSLKWLLVDTLSLNLKDARVELVSYSCVRRDWSGKKRLKAWNWNFSNATKLNLDWRSSWGRKLLNPDL